MRLHSKLESSCANGPGNRAVLWFAGCTLNCSGCWNPETHSFDVRETATDEIETWLLSLSGIDGVTFSGGEPMQHYPALSRLVYFIRDKRPALSIGMFTGYSLPELQAGRFQYRLGSRMSPGCFQMWEDLSRSLDFAVCGRFNRLQPDSAPMCGSANQRIELLSNRYTLNDFTEQVTEVTLSDELIQITGFPGLEFLAEMREL